MHIIVCYIAYLVLSLAVTIWVAQTLRSRGSNFLIYAFQGNRELADSVNHLLVVGFYLINVGYVTLALRTADPVPTVRSAIELVCDKIGVVLILLGVMHFVNLYIFSRLRRKGQAEPHAPLPPNPAIAVGRQ